jgi:hypothetical protein
MRIQHGCRFHAYYYVTIDFPHWHHAHAQIHIHSMLASHSTQKKGLVVSLLALKPEDHGKGTVLEVTAGGKHWHCQTVHVILEDERVGKDLLGHGGITARSA